MKYSDGQDVRLSDRVELADDAAGVVVCSIDTGDYSEEHPESAWSYLKRGVMVSFPQYGLIHYEEPESDLQLVERATTE
jgi:hypothetical protein